MSDGHEETLLNSGKLGIKEIRIPVPWGYIAGKAWGDPIHQRVLAVHGWMDNAGSFDGLLPLLRQSLYIVAIEMPGHGRSSHLPMGITYHYIDYVATLRRVIRYLGWDKYWYIGHSMGGSLGFILASLFPNEMERMISIDQTKTITDPASECRMRYKDGLNVFLSLDKIQKAENANPKGFSYQTSYERLIEYTRHCNYPLTEGGAKTLCIRGTRQLNEHEWSYNRDQRLMSSSFLRFTHADYYLLISSLKTQLLIVLAELDSGSEGEAVRGPAKQIYAQKSRNFILRKLPGNHFLHLNHPEELALEINVFFK